MASGTAPLSYQWYEGVSGTTTTPIGTNSASFTTPALTTTTSYWVRVSGCTPAVSANSAAQARPRVPLNSLSASE
ncbi:MAG TPA: hypothetical protein VGP22_02360 [Albitalea sp.]|nr:hypothetical protein [Albitalea sp.]